MSVIWKSICTFLGGHLLSEMEALQLFLSFFVICFLLSMNSGDSDYQRLSSVSGGAPRGPTELVLCWHSISLWGLGTIPSTFFFPFF